MLSLVSAFTLWTRYSGENGFESSICGKNQLNGYGVSSDYMLQSPFNGERDIPTLINFFLDFIASHNTLTPVNYNNEILSEPNYKNNIVFDLIIRIPNTNNSTDFQPRAPPLN